MSDDFYYLVDIERSTPNQNIYWKKTHGYTTSRDDAGKFTLGEAVKKCKGDLEAKTTMLPHSNYIK